jgi:hypothetical protein
MADNVSITAGAGTSIAADEIVDATLGTVKVQYVKLVDGTLDGTTKVGATANGLKVDGSAVTQPVSAASLPLPSGAATSAKQPTLGTAGSAAADVITIQGVASMTAVKVDGSATTQPISGTITANAGTGTFNIQSNASINNAQVSGTAVDVNSGNKSAGTQRIVIATDQPQLTNALKVDGSAVTQPVSGTVTATLSSTTNAGSTAKTSDYDTGAGTDTVAMHGIALPASGGAVQGGTSTNPVRVDPTGTTTQPVSGTVTANIGTSGSLALDASVTGLSLAQATTTSGQKGILNLAAVTTAAPSYTTAQSSPLSLTTAGSLRVDGSGVTQPVSGTVSANASQTGTWTVQPGNTPNSTAWLVQTVPGTANGWSVQFTSTGITNTKIAVKTSAGIFGGYMLYNPNATVAYVQVWDIASGSVTVGTTTPTYVIPIPATTGANLEIRNGITHTAAITLCATTTATGSTAPGSVLFGFFLYK